MITTTSMSAMLALLMMTLQTPAPKGPASLATLLRSIDKGLDSQNEDARQATVGSAGEWEKLWRLHAGGRARPAVDFGKEMVIAVFLGIRPTAGFSVEIVGAHEDGAALVVQYRETRPVASGIVAQVLTSPYHIAAVPRNAAVKDVKFERVN